MIKRIVTILPSILLTQLIFLCFSGTEGNLNHIERKRNFDFNWKFATGNFPDAGKYNFDDKNWRILDLPHDWSIESRTDPKHPSGKDGGYYPAGVGWYRKTFKVPSKWKNKKISVYFEGVYMNSEVFINGKNLDVHLYGYSSFKYDLTPYINFGKDNVIAVRVNNSQQKNCRWYSGSGIYRHVWLIVTSPVYIDDWGIAITTPEISKKKAIVQIRMMIKNETNSSQNMILETDIADKNGGNIAQDDIPIELSPNSQKEVTRDITVKNPLLWSVEKPYLYLAQFKIRLNNDEFDQLNIPFGIRTIRYSVEKGFELNGESIKLNGGCIHHDNGCLGAAAYDRAEERKAELLKSAGFNAVRTSHNPPSEAFLEACDRLGLLVIDESFDGWREHKTPYDYALYFDEWWQYDIESMVLRDRNHPSIIMWSNGNEIIERTEPEAIFTARMLNNYIRKLDPSRPVTSAMTTWNQGWEIFDPLMAEYDICGYNYQMHHAASDHERIPSRIILQTESYPKDAFYNWNMVNYHNYIIGDFVWTAMDYLGESGIGRYYYPGEPEGEHWEGEFYPWHGAYCGDIDLTGWRKPISHYRNILWNETEKLYMAVREPKPDNGEIKTTMWAIYPTWQNWNWSGFEGKDIQVVVYSKYQKVRLYLNDTLIGELPTTREQEFKAVFTLPYSSGKLKATGLNEGKELETAILQTTGKAVHIRLSADRTEIKADGQDLSYITTEITDTEGNLVPDAENQIYFTVIGEGVIAGAGNANLKDTSSYKSDKCTVWNGRALVVIKSTHKTGNIKVTASSPGLSKASVIIKSIGE